MPAYAGVPVTYPGGGDTMTFVRGYEDESRTPPDIDWASLARLEGTIVCYAGAQQLPRMLDALHGQRLARRTIRRPSSTTARSPTRRPCPARSWSCSSDVTRAPAARAGHLVVGRVVGLRDHLRWFDARPLFGKRVLVTRPREQAAELVDRLTALGAEAIEAPMIRIVPPDDPDPLLRAAAQRERFDWIVFTSANAVEAFMTRCSTALATCGR